MPLFRLLFLAALIFGAGIDAAQAAPIAAAIGAVSSFVGSLGIIGKLVIGVALNFGVSLLSKAAAKKADTATQETGVDLSISMGDDIPMSFLVGNYATGGKRKYIGTWGAVGGTPNAFVTDVIEISNLPVSGLSGFWVGDEKVTVLWAEPHADGRGYPVSEYRKDGVDYLWIKFHDGSQTAADAFLLDKFGAHSERPWQASQIGRGCAYAVITCRYNTDLFSGLPDWAFEPGSIRLYDLRKDSANGGAGAHRWDNPATWEPSSNPAIVAYNVIRGVYYAGSEWMFGGQNLAAFRLPSSNLIAAANECDAAVTITGGTEPAFRCGYEITLDEEPLAVLEELGRAANMRFAEVGGVFKLLVGAPGAAVYSFTDENIIITEGQSLEPFPALDQTFNGLEATYPEPSEKWASKDAPPFYDLDLEAEDGNRRLPASISLKAAPYALQVQRIMRAALLDYRRFRVHSFTLPPEAYGLEPNDVVSWSSDRNGYDDKKFLVVTVQRDRRFNVTVTLKEIDPADHDWNVTLERPVSTGWIGDITAPPQAMAGWSVTASTVNDAGGSQRRPALMVATSGGQDDVAKVWVQVRVKATQAVVFDSDANAYAAPFSWLLSGAWCLPGVTYQVRGRFLPYSQRETLWGDWLDVIAPDIRLSSADISMPGIITEVQNSFSEYLAFVGSGLRSVTDEVRRSALLTIDASVSAYSDRQRIRRELTSVRTDVTAAFTEAIDVATGPASALAQSVTVLEAQVGGATASGLFRTTVEATPAGSQSRIGLSVAATAEGATKSAGLFLEAKSDGTSLVLVSADRFAIVNGVDAAHPFVVEGGAVRMNVADIGTVNAGLIQSANGKMEINLAAGTIVISS